MDRSEVFCRPLIPGDTFEMVRSCIPEDDIRNCDCNYNKNSCHCSDTDCGWEPCIISCSCQEPLTEGTIGIAGFKGGRYV